jgi:hypothetical protein
VPVDRGAAAAARAGRSTNGGDLREVGVRAETALHLAELSWNDPETVFVLGCAREIDPGGTLGDYVVHAGEHRTIARPADQVSLVVAAGVSCAEALQRLGHIRSHLEELPPDTVLAADDSWIDRLTDRLARLNLARQVVLAEVAEEGDRA